VKEQYQYDLNTDIIDRLYHHLYPEHSISDKLERDDIIDSKIKHMKESKARSNLFTMLQFIKRNAPTRVNVMVDGLLTPLTTKANIEDHLLYRNPQANLTSGTTPFGHTALDRSLGPTGDSPLADSILDGSFSHQNRADSAFTQQLRRRSHHSNIPAARITKKQFACAFGVIREKYASSPSGLNNAHYMCLASKKNYSSSNPIRKVQVDLMELPITHGFVPDCHLVRYDCPIYKTPGDFRSEKLRLVHGVEVTENQALKISVAWEIK
jgi:hypothetical protein